MVHIFPPYSLGRKEKQNVSAFNNRKYTIHLYIFKTINKLMITWAKILSFDYGL
jgi:hypothetical protein